MAWFSVFHPNGKCIGHVEAELEWQALDIACQKHGDDVKVYPENVEDEEDEEDV